MSAIDMFKWTEQRRIKVFGMDEVKPENVNVIIVTCAECPLLLLMMTHEDEVDKAWTKPGMDMGLKVHILEIQQTE